MVIYPEIELLDGKVVRLTDGDLDKPNVIDVDPVELAQKYAAAGAQWLYMVDLDAIQQGGRFNHEIILKIIESVNIPVQVAGGMRTIASIEWWIEHGATRVVLGTLAVKDRNLVRQACAQFPGRIVVSIDAGADGYVYVEGWKEKTAYTAMQLGKELQSDGVAEIIYTDINADPELPESTFSAAMEMGRQLAVPVISSGLTRSLDAISTIKYLENISGTVVGYALLDGKFTLEEAIAVSI